jgi:hypothetical protein
LALECKPGSTSIRGDANEIVEIDGVVLRIQERTMLS